jgi:hypothetical protein
MSYAAKPVPARDDGNNSLAMVSLILGIVGLVTGGCPFSLAAAITGWMGMKREPSGTAKIGFWLGVVGMILQALLALFLLLFFGAALGIGLTAVEMKPAPMAPAPPMVVNEVEPPAIESAPVVGATPESAVEATPPDAATNPVEPPVEEVPETAP